METDLVRFGRIACFVASAAMFAVPSIAKASESQTRFADRLAVAMKGSQRFESSRSLHDLRESVVSLAGVQDFSGLSVDDVENRRSIVTSFLQIFKQIDAATDPTFSTDHDPVYDCLIPPPEGDMQLPSCADPSDIKDPRVRATYVAALKANELKIERNNFQSGLIELDALAMVLFAQTLSDYRAIRAPVDSEALFRIVRASGVSDKRERELDRVIVEQSSLPSK